MGYLVSRFFFYMLELKKFHAIWCGPCRVLNPVFDQLASKNTNVSFTHIDIDDEPQEASDSNVRSVPTIIVEKDGVEVDRFVGVQSLDTYQNSINKHLS